MDLKRIKEYSEAVLAFSLAFSVCAYILGFVIVNSYFVAYGFYLEEIINVRYLAAALLLLFSTGIFLIALLAIKRDENNKVCAINIKWFAITSALIYFAWIGWFRAHAFKSIFFSTYGYFILLNLGTFFLILLPYSLYSRKKDKSKFNIFLLPQLLFLWIFAIPEFLVFILWNVIIISIIVKEVEGSIQKKQQSGGNFLSKAITPLLLIILVIGYASFFGGIIYPLISRDIGGGKPLTVNLLINTEKQKNLEGMGIEIDKNGWTKELNLIYKGRDSTYLESVQPTKFSCIEIKNDIIDSVRYVGICKLNLFGIFKEVTKSEEKK
jgi:hypothetical protein